MVRTLGDALGEIEDRRGCKGRQYPLQLVPGIALAAMLAGANDLIAIFRWGRRSKHPRGPRKLPRRPHRGHHRRHRLDSLNGPVILTTNVAALALYDMVKV